VKTLLIVDDEKPTRDALRMALEESFDCYLAADLKQASEVLKSEDVDLLLTDLRLGADSGMEVLAESTRRCYDDSLWFGRYCRRSDAPRSLALCHKATQSG